MTMHTAFEDIIIGQVRSTKENALQEAKRCNERDL